MLVLVSLAYAFVVPPPAPVAAAMELRTAVTAAPIGVAQPSDLLYPPPITTTTLLADDLVEEEKISPAKAKILAAKEAAATKAAKSDQSAARKAAAMREATAQEDLMKKERAATAIKRMDETEAAKEREIEKQLASGVKPCKSSVWGSGQSGLLQAEVCVRVRDGFGEEKARTGAFLIF